MEDGKERKKQVLIVDDEPDFVLALQNALKSERCEIFTADSKKQAQQVVKTVTPDLVILGTLSPRGEAFLLHQWFRENPKTKDLPVVVIDAAPDKQFVKGWRRDEAMLMDAEEYLAKPIEPGALAARTQTILDRASKRIRVLIVDDHRVVRDGLESVLELESDIQVIGQAEDGKDALKKVAELGPDIVVMDIVMPEMNGLEATKEIYKNYSQTRVVMLSQYDDEANILAAEQLGAYGFIPKRAASSQVVNAIRAIHYLGKRLERPSRA